MARGDELGCWARVEKGRERLGCLLEAIATILEKEEWEMSAALEC